MTAEQLTAVSDQNLATTFSSGYPAASWLESNAVMFFHFNVGVIDPAQTKLTFSWNGSIASSVNDGVQIRIFNQTTQSWDWNNLVVSKNIPQNQLTSLAVVFDQTGNSGTHHSQLNINNLVGPSGDVWFAVWVEYGTSTLTTAEVSLQKTTPSSVEPNTTVNLTGTAGANDWFTSSPVTISFSAIPAGGTITKTEYSLNSGPFQTYAGSFTIGTEGTTRLQYRSYDSAGNIEGLMWREVKIDTRPPIAIASFIMLFDANSQYQDTISFSSLLGATLNFAPLIFFQDAMGSEEATFYYRLNGGAITELGGNSLKIDVSGGHLLEFWAVDQAGQESPHVEATFTLDFSNYQQTLGSDGGTVNTYYGDSLTVPTGALSTTTDITAQVISSSEVSASLPEGAVVLPRAYQFGPSGTTFAQPATVVFKYTDADLGGGDPANLGVYVWDSTLGQWVLKQGVVDTEAKTLTVQLEHFSLFILAIDNTPPMVEISPSAQNYLLGTSLAVVISDNLSGVVSSNVTLDGLAVENPQQINLSQLGWHSLAITAVDQMGNAATKNFDFNVYALTWLPPLSTQDVYTMQDGSTLPLKFSLLDSIDNFIADNSVKLEAYNSTGQLVAGPFNEETNPAIGIDTQSNQYHLNIQTKSLDLTPDTYTLKVSFASPFLYGSSSTSFILLEGGKALGKSR